MVILAHLFHSTHSFRGLHVGRLAAREKYVSAAIANVKEKLAKVHQALPPKCDTPFASNYRPELDETD
jgi:hypothetical protein